MRYRTRTIFGAAPLAVLLSACVTARPPAAAPAPRSVGNAPVRWTPARGGAITLWVDSSVGTPGWRPEFSRLVADAADAWSTVGAAVHFQRVDLPDHADVRVRWRRWEPGPERGATTRWVNTRGEMISVDVVIVLAPGPARPVSSPSQLRAIALHELGHALGLPHDPSHAAIMYRDVGPLALSDRDRDALRASYGTSPASLTRVASARAGRADDQSVSAEPR
jgi:hypothetical protein